MSERERRPYGSWPSPITANLVASAGVSLGQIVLDGDRILWAESRPSEGGKTVIVEWIGDAPRDLLPEGFNARSRVHEYGGGAFSAHNGTLVFSNYADNRVFRMDPSEAPVPIAGGGDMRYADFSFDPGRNRVICVREDHSADEREAVNTLVGLSLDAESEGTVLIAGSAFYASPRLSPDGSRLAWLSWNHPNMPWDGTELWVAPILEDGTLGESHLVAGGPEESIFQPEWSPAGRLHFCSDQTGWWNLYREDEHGIEALTHLEAEIGEPQWIFGLSVYDFVSEQEILCLVNRRNLFTIASLDTRSLEIVDHATPYTSFAGLRVGPGMVVVAAASPVEPWAIVRFDTTTMEPSVLRRSSSIEFDAAFISGAKEIEFESTGGRTVFAWFYAPANPTCDAPEDESPPLIVISHGGPTDASGPELNMKVQFWTSRGFAVLDVNYGGSTGYGRAYREVLDGAWGVTDVDDCVNGALHVAGARLVDPERLLIRGSSAGGFTTLCALTFADLFRSGANLYGVADLESLVQDTHKFEARYLDRLVGPYPEERQLYVNRSPINHIDRIACPMIVFQGLDDKVVPPSQSEMIVESLRARGLPFAYCTFEGEGHGFRKAETVASALKAELYFYARVLHIHLPGAVHAVPIVNEEALT